jgi:hypothetical protein
MTDLPVLVTVVPANTAKDLAVPRPTGGWAAVDANFQLMPPSTTMPVAIPSNSNAAIQLRRKPKRRIRITDVLPGRERGCSWLRFCPTRAVPKPRIHLTLIAHEPI